MLVCLVLNVVKSVSDFLLAGQTDSEIAEQTCRFYGVSALDALCDAERKKELMDDLTAILSPLNESQRSVLLLIGAGENRNVIANALSVTPQRVSQIRNSISETLESYADEERIQFLATKVVELAATSRGRHSKLYEELCAELDSRYAVREALKRLFVALLPPSSTKVMDGKTSLPAYTFERLQAVNIGMREGIENGRKVMKSVTKCVVPEYLNNSFKTGVCCTICKTCKRKKDVVGRQNLGKYGYAI